MHEVHNQHFKRPQNGYGVQIVHGALVAAEQRVAGRQEHETAIADDVEYHDEACAVLRQAVEEEAAEYTGQDRQTDQHNERIEEGLESGREEVDHRTDDHREDREHNADVLADRDQLFIAGVLVDEFLVDVHREHGVYRVEHRVERGQDRAEHNGCEKAHDRLGNNAGDQCRICVIHHGYLRALDVEDRVSDNARQREKHKAENLEECTVERTLLCFLEVFSSEYTLDERLMRAPRLEAEEYQTEEYGRPRNRRCFALCGSDGVEHVCVVMNEIAHTVHDSNAAFTAGGMAEHVECQEWDHQTADQQAHAVDGIRYCNSLQTAEDSVNRADDSDKDTQDNDGLELGNAKDSGQVENVFKHQRTRVQDYRNLHEQVQNDVCDGEPQLSGSVIALTEQLRDGGDAAFQVARRGKQRQHDECGRRHYFERHRAHADRPGLSVCTDKLLCGEVGQQQRACNDNAR